MNKVRQTLTINEAVRDALNNVTEGYKITQVEALEIILKNVDMDKIGPLFIKHREEKLAQRAAIKSSTVKELALKLSELSDDQLDAIKSMIGARK